MYIYIYIYIYIFHTCLKVPKGAETLGKVEKAPFPRKLVRKLLWMFISKSKMLFRMFISTLKSKETVDFNVEIKIGLFISTRKTRKTPFPRRLVRELPGCFLGPPRPQASPRMIIRIREEFE